ncbi:MAG: hypothetical protein ACLFNN_01640 [Candidatus Paceibacterota bacterium]
MKKILKHTTLLLISLFLVSGTLFLAHQEAKGMSTFVPVHDSANTLMNQTNAKTNFTHVTNDAWHTGKWYAKEYVLDELVWVFAKEIIMGKIKKEIMTWVTDGFDDEPSFVKNPDSFFEGLGVNIADKIIDEHLSFLCDDFEEEIGVALEYHYKTNYDNSYENNLECTLDDAYENLSSGDFYEGGYEALFKITQNDRNNPYGAYRRSSENIDNEIARQSQLAQMELEWGSGFFSGRDGENITMPGNIGKEQLNHFIQSDIRQLEQVDELTEGIAVLAGALVTGMMDNNDLSGGAAGDDDWKPTEDEDEEWNWKDHEPDDPTDGALGDPEELDEDSESPDQGYDDTLAGQSFTADIENPNIEIKTGDSQKSLEDINLNSVTDMQFVGGDGDSGTIKAGSSNTVEVGSITFRYPSGSDETDPNTMRSYPQTKKTTLSNVTVEDPVFRTIEGSTEADPGGNEATGVHYLGSVSFSGDEAIKAKMTDANVGGDDGLSGDDLEGSYILQGSEGSKIDKVTKFDPHASGYQEHNEFSFDKNDLRGGVIEVNEIDNIRIVGGTVVDQDGNTYEITRNYCQYNKCPYSDYEADGVTGEGLHIDDRFHGAWSYQSYGLSGDKSVKVIKPFTMNAGEIIKVY